MSIKSHIVNQLNYFIHSRTVSVNLTSNICMHETFLFVYEIYREPLNGFAPNSQERRVWSLARINLNVKVRGQRSRSPGTKNGIFRPFRRLACVL